jgi:hypothetical protein
MVGCCPLPSPPNKSIQESNRSRSRDGLLVLRNPVRALHGPWTIGIQVASLCVAPRRGGSERVGGELTAIRVPPENCATLS